MAAATIHLSDRRWLPYTLSRGGSFGMVLCSSCLTFCVVNGGYQAFRMISVLKPKGEPVQL